MTSSRKEVSLFVVSLFVEHTCNAYAYHSQGRNDLHNFEGTPRELSMMYACYMCTVRGNHIVMAITKRDVPSV